MAVEAIKTLEAMDSRAGDAVARFPAQVTTDDLEQADWVVALKQAEYLPLLRERFPAWTEKVVLWHIDDAPEALGLIEREVMGLVARIVSGNIGPAGQPAGLAPAPIDSAKSLSQGRSKRGSKAAVKGRYHE
jgi:hypothetical protein